MPTSLFSRHRDPRPTISDYVIIGAGAAGCVLAARLSEDPTVSVLLLEAGGSSAPLASRVPAAFPTLFRSRHDWAYDTEPGPGSAGTPRVLASGAGAWRFDGAQCHGPRSRQPPRL